MGVTGNNIDVMTWGFTGIAAMHPWGGYSYGFEKDGILEYDERNYWPATISAEKHMNSDKVISVLGIWDGDWKQGRQVAKVNNVINKWKHQLSFNL